MNAEMALFRERTVSGGFEWSSAYLAERIAEVSLGVKNKENAMLDQSNLPEYEEIFCDKKVLAIIVRSHFKSDKVKFFTRPDSSQQIGYLPHKSGSIITPHVHRQVLRNITDTQEVLFVRSGKVKVNIYTEKKEYVNSRVLETGDAILLCGGGHGFEFGEDTDLFEVKQGPYIALEDKERFVGVEGARSR